MTITAQQYAKKVNVTGATVTRHLKNGKLHGVSNFYKVGNTWQLVLNEDFNAKAIKKNFRKKSK